MGYFDFTCSFTHTAIKEDDKVVVVVLNKRTVHTEGGEGNFNNLRYCVNEQKPELCSFDKENIKTGEYKLGDFQPIHSVHVGTYNGIGNLSELDLEVNEDQEVQMYHTWIIEYLFGTINITDKIKFVKELYWKMYTLRKNPLDLEVIGVQHSDIDEMEEMIKINNKINEELRNQINRMK